MLGMDRIIGVNMVGMVGKHATFFAKLALDNTMMRPFRQHIGSSGSGRMKRTLKIYSLATVTWAYFNVIHCINEPADN